MRALRREPGADSFPQDVLELQAFLAPVQQGQTVQAVPGAGLKVPLWILGSSLFGAQLAAMLGLPYAFASHFAPSALMPALQAYRSGFKRSQQLDRPYVAAGVNVFVADTDARARRLFTSAQQQFTNLLRGAPGRLQPPLDDIEAYWTPAEKAQASAMLTCSFVGSAETVRHGLSEFIEQTGVDELIVASAIYDHAARLRFYEILADLLAAKVQSEKQGIRATFRMPSRSLRPPYGSRTTNKAPPSGGSGPRPYPRKSRGRNDAGRIWQLRLPFLSRRA